MSRRCVASILLAAMLIAPAAFAQGADKATSVALFDEAQQLMADGNVAEACSRFAESHRLDPQLGTLLHLSDCLEQNGQTASAWASFREAAELAHKRSDPRQVLAEERAAALQPKLSKLRIEVAAGQDPKATHVERDGIVVASALWGTPLPMDPGPHTITASAPGRQRWTGTVVVPGNGSTVVIQVPMLESEIPRSPESSSASAVEPAEPTDVAEDRPEPSDDGLARRWPALVAGGVGVVGIAVGTVFGLKSQSKRNESDTFCTGNVCTDPRGVELRDEAIAAGNVSTVGFIIGGVGLAAGAVLWFALPGPSAPESAALRLGVGASSVRVEGVF
jgi:hypothetical protein